MYRAGETLKSPTLPGFTLSVDDLFRTPGA
jgi:hypothetical protein